jgi:methylated-DNA-protein-cysteine methyltransferase-like protein
MKKISVYSRIYSIIHCIPCGKVATYGKIASWAGLAGGARQVGYALHSLPEGSEVPWHRVINSKGQISLHPDHPSASLQRKLLESEGIIFSKSNRIDLKKYQCRSVPIRGRNKLATDEHGSARI